MLCSSSTGRGLRELEMDGDPQCRIYSVARHILDTREWVGKAAARLPEVCQMSKLVITDFFGFRHAQIAVGVLAPPFAYENCLYSWRVS